MTTGQVIIGKIVDKIPKNLSYKKWIRISIGLFVFGASFAFTKPVFLQAIIRYLYVGTPGHYVRWKHESIQKFTYKLYFWNITNPNEFESGKEIPKLQEIGPYVFNQQKRKVDPVDNEAADTVSFNYWNIYRFNPESTLPLTGNETLTILNLVLTAAMAKVKLELPHLMNVSIESFDTIFKKPASMFMTVKAMDVIDKGIEVDCNQTVYAAKVVCRELRKHKAFTVVDNHTNLIRFRWFDHLNNTLQGRYTVLRGSRNVLDVGRVTAVNNEPILNVYKEDNRCNIINGTDKMYFAPFQQKNDILWVHDEAACKSFPLRLKNMKMVRGVKTAYKFLDPSDPLMNPACECNKFTGCAAKGTIDLFNCLDFFGSGSLPHFYLADPSILDTVHGMNPVEKLHETGVHFDLLSSAPISARERFQINILVKKIPEYHVFGSIAKDIWLPLLWYDESYSIPIFDMGLVIGSIISRLTGVAAGYLLMFIGTVIGVVMLLGRLQVQLLKMHHIIAVQPVSEEKNDTEPPPPTMEHNAVKAEEPPPTPPPPPLPLPC